ncbi:MAG: glycosyltransferase family 2 protein [Candidatus Gracilibacteria bacterium]
MRTKVSAIIPCYNEAKRIEAVLRVLTKTKIIDEIIVVDDGSKDNTEEIVKKFRTIKYLKNKKNLGKATAMEKGVKNSTGDVLFFCDADLKGFDTKMVETIIKPVLSGKTDMFIGVRSNFREKKFKAIGLMSGERALKREIWDSLPHHYKHKFRIEMGLNSYAEHYGKGYKYKELKYDQPVKEEKFGTLMGMWKRITMWWQVYMTYLTFNIIHLPETKKNLQNRIIKFCISLLTIMFSAIFIIISTKIGYRYVLNVLRSALSKHPDAEIIPVIFSILREVTHDTFMVLGVTMFTIGIIYSIVNIIAIIRMHKNKQSLN